MPKQSDKVLTDTICRKAKPAEARYSVPDAKTPGLELRVMPTGSKTWTFRYRAKSGQQRRVSFGAYPAKTLKAARDEAAKTKGQVGVGMCSAIVSAAHAASWVAGRIERARESA